LGNWFELLGLVEEMNKESTQLLNCDFDLVSREEQVAIVTQLAA
jgi:hypothetical protein